MCVHLLLTYIRLYTYTNETISNEKVAESWKRGTVKERRIGEFKSVVVDRETPCFDIGKSALI